MPKKQSEGQLCSLREAFSMFDKNGDGLISAQVLQELGEVMRSLGASPRDDELKAMIAEVDADQNGAIDFAEFVEMMKRDAEQKEPEADRVEALREAFRAFDRDGNGVISADELRLVMVSVGMQLSDAELDGMMREADLNHDGLISFDEFLSVMSTDV